MKALRAKLPKFEEKDEIDVFLERFERFATAQNWPEEIWAVSLCPCLTGKGLEDYTSMPPIEIDNYKELKKSVVKEI